MCIRDREATLQAARGRMASQATVQMRRTGRFWADKSTTPCRPRSARRRTWRSSGILTMWSCDPERAKSPLLCRGVPYHRRGVQETPRGARGGHWLGLDGPDARTFPRAGPKSTARRGRTCAGPRTAQGRAVHLPQKFTYPRGPQERRACIRDRIRVFCPPFFFS